MMKAAVVALVLSCLDMGLAGATADAPSREPPLAELFPQSGQIAGWVRTEGPALFVGEEIFQYMDGAGEIPRSYGFRRLGTARYLQGEAALEVVLFEMEDSAAAYGYYSVRDRDPDEQFVSLEEPLPIRNPQSAIRNPQSAIRARLLPGFALVTWKDHHTLVVRVEQGAVQDEVLIQFGQAVLANLPGKGSPPDLLRYLPRKDSIAHPAKYVRGKAAFDAEVKFIPEDVFGLRNSRVEIVAGEYREGQDKERTPGRSPYRLVLLRYPNNRDAAQAFRAFAASRLGSGGGTPEDPWVVPDPTDQFVGAFHEGKFVGVVLNAPERERAWQILRDFQSFVDRPASRWKLRGSRP
jgi:hypothetical protein